MRGLPAGFCFFLLALAASLPPGLSAAGGTNLLFENRFETEADFAGMGLESSCLPVALSRRIDPTEHIDGQASLLLAYRFRKSGSFYPGFRLPAPISLEQGPVYLSGYLKVLRQDPEAQHNFNLTACGTFPGNPAAWKGFEFRCNHAAARADGWLYFYSDDLAQAAQDQAGEKKFSAAGAVLTGFYIQIWDARPGKELEFRLDSVQVTRTNPVPPPDAKAYAAAVELCAQMQQARPEWQALADPSVKALEGILQEAAGIQANAEQLPPDTARALFAGKIQAAEKHYWKLKIIALANNGDN